MGDKEEADLCRDNVSLMTTGYFEAATPSPHLVLTDLLLELQRYQRGFIALMTTECDAFQQGPQQQMQSMHYTFKKIPTYEAKVVNMAKRMRVLEGRVKKLKQRSVSLNKST